MSFKGQLSMEFILILTLVILLIQVIILPVRDFSESSMNRIKAVNYLESASLELSDKINMVSYMDSAKVFVDFYIPKDSNFYIDNRVLKYEVMMDKNIAQCNNSSVCKKEFSLNSNISNFRIESEGKYRYELKKQDGDLNLIKVD